MIQSKSLGSKIFNVFNIILMSLLSLSCLYPLWYTLCLSVSDKAAANSGKVSFYPVGFSLAFLSADHGRHAIFFVPS